MIFYSIVFCMYVCFPLAMTGFSDPRTISIDPTTGNLYVAQASGSGQGIALVGLVRSKTWTPLLSRTYTPTGQPTRQPSRQPSQQPTGDSHELSLLLFLVAYFSRLVLISQILF
jgi:hypothetical protein